MVKRFIFKDDPEKEPRPGWGPFKFDKLLKRFFPFVQWHDKVTTDDSEAEKLGVTVEQLNEIQNAQIDNLMEGQPGIEKMKGRFLKVFLRKINRFFYRGPLGKSRTRQDPPQGDMF